MNTIPGAGVPNPAVMVLHELRTPLTVVSGRLQLLQWRVGRGMSDPVQLAAELAAISAAAERMGATLETLAASARAASRDALSAPAGGEAPGAC